jgi:hypothetical protein
MADLKCFARSALISNGRRVEVRFAEIDGRLVCIGLEIGPQMVDLQDRGETFINVKDEDLRPLMAAEVRLPLRRLIDFGLQGAVMSRVGTGDVAKDHQAFAADLDVLNAAKAEPRRRPGRPAAYAPAHFEEVARIYREHVRAGGRAPTKAVQEHFTVSKSAAAKWVGRARHEFGLLEPTREKSGKVTAQTTGDDA